MTPREKHLSIIFVCLLLLTIGVALKLHENSKQQWWTFDGFKIQFDRPSGMVSLHNTSGLLMTNIIIEFEVRNEKTTRTYKEGGRSTSGKE